MNSNANNFRDLLFFNLTSKDSKRILTELGDCLGSIHLWKQLASCKTLLYPRHYYKYFTYTMAYTIHIKFMSLIVLLFFIAHIGYLEDEENLSTVIQLSSNTPRIRNQVICFKLCFLHIMSEQLDKYIYNLKQDRNGVKLKMDLK